MKKLLLVACVVSACFPLVVAGQKPTDQLKDFSRVLPGDLPLTLVYLNDKTVPIMFQPPTLYAMRARSKEATMLYVQGTAGDKAVQFDTTNFTIEQSGESVGSTPTNINHFERGKASVGKGDRVDGLLTFAKLVNVSQPFTVKHGKDSVEFKFTADQIKAMTSAAQ
jgi:hypothetical protein